MTTNSTKYFCNRGALSARFILVDTPLRGEYYYDGEHGKYYFGARYFDPFFGMWMSPDPAAVFFREVYAPLKWRDFIEKDILQRLNGEAVLLKHSFRASAQFANPYTHGGDPINGKDYNGLWFGIDDAIAAGVGAVVGFATYLITHDDWDWKQAMVYTGIGAGAGWLTWNTGGSTLALEAGKTGGLAANLTLAQTMGYGAVSSGVGAGFTSAATYTEKAAYGNNGYSIQNLEDNWNAKDFATATLTGAVVGAGIGAGMAGASWGINYYSNLASNEFYNIPDEELSEADQFVKKNRLRRSPVDKGWKSDGINKSEYGEIVDVMDRQTLERDDWLFADNFSNAESGSFRYEGVGGGLHVNTEINANGVTKYVGHYDAFDPADGFFSMLGHGYEFLRGKTWFGSSVSYFEPSLIVPVVNGFIFDWEKTNWFGW